MLLMQGWGRWLRGLRLRDGGGCELRSGGGRRGGGGGGSGGSTGEKGGGVGVEEVEWGDVGWEGGCAG